MACEAAAAFADAAAITALAAAAPALTAAAADFASAAVIASASVGLTGLASLGSGVPDTVYTVSLMMRATQ